MKCDKKENGECSQVPFKRWQADDNILHPAYSVSYHMTFRSSPKVGMTRKGEQCELTVGIGNPCCKNKDTKVNFQSCFQKVAKGVDMYV